MINSKSLEEVKNSVFSSSFVKPLYKSYCFSNIPGTITNILTAEKDNSLPRDVFEGIPSNYDKVVFILVDAFGWAFFEKYYEKYPMLGEIVKNGCVSKLTSQFPSTTASHVTTIHTGLPVNISGVYEWFYYEPAVGSVIAPLLFSKAEDDSPETLKSMGIDPKRVFPEDTIYKRLKSKGVSSYTFHNHNINNSSYSSVILKGANIQGYSDVQQGLSDLANLLIETPGKAYFYFYISEIDNAGHHFGPASHKFEEQVDSILTSLERILYNGLSGKLKNTLLLISADHGQVDIDTENPIYLNIHHEKIKTYLETDNSGKYLVPCGSFRDMFLHIKEECINECLDYLKTNLQGTAEVYKTSDLIRKGVFGCGQPSYTFLQRVGNIVVLPYEGKSVWWYEQDKFMVQMPGMHGGLTREEAEIPFLAYPFI